MLSRRSDAAVRTSRQQTRTAAAARPYKSRQLCPGRHKRIPATRLCPAPSSSPASSSSRPIAPRAKLRRARQAQPLALAYRRIARAVARVVAVMPPFSDLKRQLGDSVSISFLPAISQLLRRCSSLVANRKPGRVSVSSHLCRGWCVLLRTMCTSTNADDASRSLLSCSPIPVCPVSTSHEFEYVTSAGIDKDLC